MRYSEWFETHAKKHQELIEKLKTLSREELIEYFRYDNMVKNEPQFCPLYEKGEKCHDMEALNCFLCACPNFRFSDEGIAKEGKRVIYSYCSIDSKEGSRYISEDAIHQDCTKCLVPHYDSYIRQHFDRDWRKIMGSCDQSSSHSV